MRIRSLSFALAFGALFGTACEDAGGSAQALPIPRASNPLPATVATVVDAKIADVSARPSSAEARRGLAMAYEANGRAELAFTAYRQAVELDPDDAQANYHLARMQREHGDYAAALATIARVNELAPSYGPAFRRRGDWLFECGLLEDAEAAYRAALDVDGDIASALSLARLALEQERYEVAVQFAEEVLSIAPELSYAAHLMGKALQAQGASERAQPLLARFDGSAAPDPDPWRDEVGALEGGYHAAMEAARSLVGTQRGQEALTLLEGMFAEHRDDVTMQSMLCAAYIDVGRFDDAFALLTAALERQPEHYRIVMNLAIVERARGRLEDALEHARHAVELHAGYAVAWDLYGKIATALDRLPEAIRAYEGAVRCGGPDQVRYLLRLGVRQLADERAVDALETFARVTELAPFSSAGHLGMAEAAARGSDLRGARIALDRARALDPESERLVLIERLLNELGEDR